MHIAVFHCCRASLSPLLCVRPCCILRMMRLCAVVQLLSHIVLHTLCGSGSTVLCRSCTLKSCMAQLQTDGYCAVPQAAGIAGSHTRAPGGCAPAQAAQQLLQVPKCHTCRLGLFLPPADLPAPVQHAALICVSAAALPVCRLPSFTDKFQAKEPLTRIRDIAHRNDIPHDIKKEIKHTIQVRRSLMPS